MKKKIITFVMLVTLIFSTSAAVSPKKADAVAFIMTPGLGVGIAAALTLAAGSLAMWGGIRINLDDNPSGECWSHRGRLACDGDESWVLALDALGAMTAFVGLLLLPDDSQTPLAVQTLNQDQVAKISEKTGLTENEADSFNRDIDEVNAVLEEVTAEMLKEKNFTPQFAQEVLKINGAALAPETFSAFSKVCAYNANLTK